MAKTVSVQPKTESVQAAIGLIREQIALQAWQIAAARGYGHDRELDDWLTAESQLFRKPEIRLEERDDAFIAKFWVPDVQPQAIQVYADQQSIAILGEAIAQELDKSVHVHRDEFRYGRIYRELTLPSLIDPDQVKTQLSNGVLKVTLPRPRVAEARKQAKAPARRKKAA